VIFYHRLIRVTSFCDEDVVQRAWFPGAQLPVRRCQPFLDQGLVFRSPDGRLSYWSNPSLRKLFSFLTWSTMVS
jgi:hypothetical protein